MSAPKTPTVIGYLLNDKNQGEHHNSTIYSVVSTSSTIISGSKDGSIRVWDKKTRELKHPPLTVQNRRSTIVALDVNEDENLIFNGDGQGNVMIWDLRNGELLQEFEKAHDEVRLY
jgi:WD40 repeat protein